MTTIACDGTTVAADGLRVCGSEITDHSTVKLRRVDGTIFGCTGVVAAFDAAISWYRDGANPETFIKFSDPQEHFRLVVFKYDRCLSYVVGCPYPDVMSYPQAFGSGADYALTAMHLGKTAEEAIEVAARLDVFTGGEVRAERLDLPAFSQEAAE